MFFTGLLQVLWTYMEANESLCQCQGSMELRCDGPLSDHQDRVTVVYINKGHPAYPWFTELIILKDSVSAVKSSSPHSVPNTIVAMLNLFLSDWHFHFIWNATQRLCGPSRTLLPTQPVHTTHTHDRWKQQKVGKLQEHATTPIWSVKLAKDRLPQTCQGGGNETQRDVFIKS